MIPQAAEFASALILFAILLEICDQVFCVCCTCGGALILLGLAMLALDLKQAANGKNDIEPRER